MVSMKILFGICIALALMSTALAFAPKQATIDLQTAVSMSVTLAAVGSTAIVYLERKRIGYKWFVQDIPLEKNSQLMRFLQIDKIIPAQNYIMVQNNDKLIGHAYARITEVPYLIDDLDRDRKLFFVGNFARILSTLSFTFEIIPRIMPISTEAYLKNIHKQIEDLRMTISAEGKNANPARQARQRHLEKLSERLLHGEGARDVGFLAHIMVQRPNENKISRQLDSNMKTMISALESGLGVRAKRLEGYKMLEAVQEFFRASSIIRPANPCRMLSWDIAYLIPFTRPKIPPAEKLLGGVYLGRTRTGAIACLDLKKYANPHVVVLGKSGFGKSTTVKTFISRLFDLSGTPILVIDYAGEYLSWVKSRNGTIIDMRNDRINPFELGHTMLVDRIRQVVDAFTKTCDFKTINQRNAFAQYVTKVYVTKGFKLNKPETWKLQPPTLSGVIELMEKDLPKLPMIKQLTIQSLISRLQVLASGPFGVFGHSTISLNQITEGLTCIDLSKLTSSSLKDLIAWTILQYLDTLMRLEGVREEIRLVIVLDEAWKLCKDADSLPVTIIKEGRKYGYSLIVSTQDVIDVAEPILSNAGTAIIHRTEHPRYLNFFKKAYDLTKLEISKVKNLPIGEALIKISIDSKPFLVKVDMEKPEAPTETIETKHSTKKRFSYTETGKNSPPLPNQANLSPPFTSDLYKLTEVEKKILKIVAEEHVFSISELYSRADVNQRQGNKTKNQLIGKDLIRTLKLPKITGRGRRPQGITLTEIGMAEARNRGFNLVPEAGRRGGLLHRYLAKLTHEEFKKSGYHVEVEQNIGDSKTIDLVVNGKIAVEIETGHSDIQANIMKLKQFDQRLIICADRPTKRRIQKLAEQHDTKVSVIEPSELPQFLNRFSSVEC